jgi:NADPH-dependent 2,4-dienoyl-CoA reductase/sulfur reductase-like enzyme
VVESAAKVRLGAKRTPAPRATKTAGPASVVVLGAGAAGEAAVETLRREGYEGPITLLGHEGSVPVDRPNLSKDYLAGNAPEEWIPLRPESFFEELRVTLRVNEPVAALDTGARRLTLASGKTVTYDALIFATGAEPAKLAIPGADLPTVHTLRSLADSRAIIARAEKGKRAVVVGASFIGLEAAASLRARGVEVDVVAPGGVPLARVMGEELGRFVQRVHEEHGVRFHLGHKPAAIDAAGVRLDDGSTLAADFVVVGVGVRPRTALAEAAGIKTDNGIVVDDYLATSAPGVYAAGDVARHPDARSGELVRIEHWVVAQRQGQVAARNVLGKCEKYAFVPFFWSNHYDVAIAYVGHALRWDRIERKGSLDRTRPR